MEWRQPGASGSLNDRRVTLKASSWLRWTDCEAGRMWTEELLWRSSGWVLSTVLLCEGGHVSLSRSSLAVLVRDFCRSGTGLSASTTRVWRTSLISRPSICSSKASHYCNDITPDSWLLTPDSYLLTPDTLRSSGPSVRLEVGRLVQFACPVPPAPSVSPMRRRHQECNMNINSFYVNVSCVYITSSLAFIPVFNSVISSSTSSQRSNIL